MENTKKTNVKEDNPKKSKKRTYEDLKQTVHGKLILMTRWAENIAKKNGYEDIPNLEDPKSPGEVRKSPGSMFYRVTNKDGAIYRYKTNSDVLNSLVKSAEAAQDDIAEGKYSNNVKNFLNEITAIKAPRATISPAIVRGIKF